MTKVAALVGPTGVGKTSMSLDVAEALGCEIVSIDSMQAYRGMDIGTDKLPPQQRRGIVHHLLDFKDPHEELTVAEFQRRGRSAINEIAARGRLPLLVGGSGLYFRAIVDHLSFPPRSPELRTALEDEAEEIGAEALHARLQELDPTAARKIEPGNARRTIRALEVIVLTGRPFSDNDSWDRYESVYKLAVAGVSRSRPELHERIERRVDDMFRRGLRVEARRLGALSRTARQALGYKQILDAPDTPDGLLQKEVVRATKRFARRQESWFRADPRVSWFEAGAPDVADAMVAFFRSALRLP